MLVIATDEAGYGPKLGPLVVVASAWHFPARELVRPTKLRSACRVLVRPAEIGQTTIAIQDSKQLFRPAEPDGRRKLHAAVSCSVSWCRMGCRELLELLETVAPADRSDLQREPWFEHLGDEPFLNGEATSGVVAAWDASPLKQTGWAARLVTPQRFNDHCRRGLNKSDLLSEATLGLVRQLVEAAPDDGSPIDVYCDRHGGRRYYGGLLQHLFPDWVLAVEAETPAESLYRLSGPRELRVRFSVRGDSFAPVAMSSILAKYLRECCMDSLNRYFAARHVSGPLPRPTAGYPTDADRFLREVQATCRRHAIARSVLVRCR